MADDERDNKSGEKKCKAMLKMGPNVGDINCGNKMSARDMDLLWRKELEQLSQVIK